MKNLLALDPGTVKCGCAYFRDGILVKAWTVHRPAMENSTATDRAIELAGLVCPPGPVDEIATERMVVYASRGRGFKGRGSSGNPDDLLDIHTMIGAVVMSLKPKRVIEYRPSEWKGQVPKEVHQPKVQESLSHAERRAAMDPIGSDSWDAVGIGRFHLGLNSKAGVKIKGA